MISLTIGTNTKRTTVIVEPNESINSILANNGVSAAGKTVNLDGSPVRRDEMESTLEDLGIADGVSATLIAVEKADSAM